MWRSIHVHYHDDDRTALLAEAIEPLVTRIAAHAPRVYFGQHWLRGPHVRINVDTCDETFAAVVRPAVDEIVRPWLAAHPSRAGLDPVVTLARHERLAELEHEDGPLGPLRPDNSVHEEPYDPRTRILGSEAAAGLLADFYVATTASAFAMNRHVRAGGQLVALAFDLMIATAHALSEVGLRRGFVSFRSHAEAFLSWWPEAEGLRTAWDAHHTRHADRLAARAGQLVAAIDRGAPLPPLVAQWLEAFAPVHRRGAALIADGSLTMNPPWAGRIDEDDPVVRELAARSTWHNHRRPEGELIDQEWFSRYKLLLNYTYLQLTRVGLAPVERFLLCHLIAGTAERAYGVRAEHVRFPAPGELAGVAS